MANEVDYDAPIFEAPDGSLFIKGPDAGEDNFDLKPTGLTLREVQKRAQQRITDAPSLSKAATQFLLGLEEGATVATPRAIGGGLEAASGLLPENYGGAALRKIGREAREGAGQIGKEYEDLSEGVGGGGVAKFARGLGSSVVPSASALLAAAPLGVLGAGAGATVTGSAVASGLQSLGGTFADAFEANKKRGMSDEEAYRKSYTPAVLSGLVTGLVTKGFGGTGLEPILLGKAVPKGFAAAVREVAKDVGMEAVEEATDEAWQAVIRSTTFNPEATAEENLQGIIQAGIAGGLMAGAVRGAQSAPSAVNDLFAGKRPTAPTPPPLPVQPAPVAPVSPATPAAAAPQVSQRVSVPVEPPPMPKISGLMLNQPLSTWSTSPSSPNILAQSPDSFGIGNKVVKLSQAGGGFGKVGTVTAITGPKVDGNPNATVTVLFDDGTTAVSGFKEFGFLENVQQAKAMSEAARGKPFEFPLPPPSPRVTLPEPPAKVDSKRTVPLDAAEQLQQRINAARSAGDAATARKLAIELDLLGTPKAAASKPRRVAITPEAQAAAPKRQQALPEAFTLPEPLEGQPYDTRLETRPEASMPAIPAATLGIERGKVAPVDPDLAAAVEDIRGGYAERVARELEEGKPPELATQNVFVGKPTVSLPTLRKGFKEVLLRDEAGNFFAFVETKDGKLRRPTKLELKQIPTGEFVPNSQGNPISAMAFDVYGTQPREGYTREGDIYIFRQSTPPAEVAPAVAAKQPEPSPDKDIIARTAPVQRVDIDNGTRVQEFRVRKTTSQEMGAQWVNYYTTPWVVERRTVKRNLDTGEVDNGEWSPFARGETRQKAIEDGLGDTAFMRAASEDDTHKKAVAKEMFAQQWRADKKKRLEEANREVNYATNAVLSIKEDANKAYKTALKRAKLFEAAGKGEADPVKIKAIQEKLQKEWFPKRDAAEAALKKASENAKTIEAETQPPYAPQEQAPVEVLRNQPPGTPAQVAEGKPREVSEAAREGAPEKRDKSKPEQMTPTTIFGLSWEDIQAKQQGKSISRAVPKTDGAKLKAQIEREAEKFKNNQDAGTVDTYGIKLPPGYIREGDLYVYRPEVKPEQLSLGQPPTARPAPSLSKMQVEQAVRELFDGSTPPNFQVTHNYGKTYNGREVRGWYDPATGAIWLNAAYLRSPQEARAVFAEEAMHAVQNDPAVQEAMGRLVGSLSEQQLSEKRTAYGNIPQQQLEMEAVSDFIKDRQLRQDQMGLLAQLWDAVLGAVERLYGKFTGKVFTERDAQDILAKALKAAAVGKRSLKGGGEVYAEGGLAAKAKAFFSRLFRTVEQSQQKKASGAQWKATIKNSKLGANLDEMALVGVNDLEDGKMYSRQEVLDYLQANQVEVKDVTLGGATKESLSADMDRADRALFEKVKKIEPVEVRGRQLFSDEIGWELVDGSVKPSDLPANLQADAERWLKTYQARQGFKEATPTHFSTYQLPGAKEGSYREVLLTVPENQNVKIGNALPGWFLFDLKTGKQLDGPYESEGSAERAHYSGTGYKLYDGSEKVPISATYEARNAVKWRDGHSQYSDIANPIVRLRFNERTTQDGKRMLFLEEVQAPQKGQFEKMPALFQKNWREIAFKWALRHAAENGFEVIGWTTGEQQAERYDLSKQVDSLHYDPYNKQLSARKGNQQILRESDVPPERIQDYVGKDAAKKLLESPLNGAGNHELKGEDLKVGGEGLKKLYDVDFRNVVNKLPAVRNAGGKVGAVRTLTATNWKPDDIKAAESGNAMDKRMLESAAPLVHSLPITPAIADSVMGGQAMFSAGSPQNQLDQKYFEAIQRGDMQEVQALVDEAARGAGYNVGPVFHGGSFDVEGGDTTLDPWTHFGTKAAAEERVGGSGVVDNLIKSITVEELDGDTGPDGPGFYYTLDGVDNDVAYASRAEAQEAAEQEALQMADYAEAPEASFTQAYLRGPFIRLPDLGTWGIFDIIKNLPEQAKLSREEIAVIGDLTRSGKLNDDWTALTEMLKAKGFNGISYKNSVEDKGSISYIAFNSNDAKSADPITYDDQGQPIPLSQRFQQESPDIRYSLGERVKGPQEDNLGAKYTDAIRASESSGSRQDFLRGTDAQIEAAIIGADVSAMVRQGVGYEGRPSGAVRGLRSGTESAAGKAVPKVRVFISTDALDSTARKNSEILASRIFPAESGTQAAALSDMDEGDFVLTAARRTPFFVTIFSAEGEKSPLARTQTLADGTPAIIFNTTNLGKFNLQDAATAAQFDGVLSEELIHVAAISVTSQKEAQDVWASLSDKEKKAAERSYNRRRNKDALSDYELGHEYLRMVIQERMFGKTTEQVELRITEPVKKFLRKLLNFIKEAFGKKPENDIARQLVSRIESALNGETPRQSSIIPSGTSLATNISQSDATEVQGRAIEPSVIAAAGRAVADLGRQTVEEYEQAGRELEGLAYESKAFRQARSELNNLVSLHEGRLRQLPQDRVTDDMRANIRDGVSIENGQIVVGDELVTKLAQMGVQARPELVKAMQAEVYFEQQARRLVDNLSKLATLKELRDYYTRIKAPADEIKNLDKLIAAKEKVVANLTPVTTNRGRGQQSIGERAGEITRANASKVELQSKRDALALEPVQEFFGKGIAELRDLSEKAKAAADLTRALMDSTTSVSELARLGEIYDRWAGFDATVKDALKQGTLTDEQRVAVLTDLQKSFHEFDAAKFRMDDLLNSEEKGLLKDIREAEAAMADAKVTSGLADALVADALKAAKGEMGLTGTVGDAANITNLEASTGAITTLAMNLGRTIDQNRWLYDFLVAPGSMPAFGASVAQSLGISETALREILKVVQQSPSLASAIVTLTDDAAAKLAASPPLQMQSIAQLATSGNPAAMALAANLTSQIVQQANAQGTKANAARQSAARQLAQSVLRLRTLQQGQALFNQTANSPAFQQLRGVVSLGASEAQKMVVLGPTGPVLRGFKSAAKEYQPELKIDVQSDAMELQKTRDKVWKYLQNAEQYVSDYESVAAAHAANPANPSPSQLGFDVADYNGLKHAIENQIWPMFLNMGDMDDAARAAQYLTPWTVRKLMKAPLFIGEVFGQYEQIAKMVGGFAGNTLRQQIANYKRGYLNAKRVASQFQDLSKLQSEAMRSHNIKSEDTYRTIFNEMAHYGRLFGSPLRAGFTLPKSGQVVTKADMEFFKRTLAFEEKLRREVTEIDPVTGVRYMRGGKEITRKGAYVGDLGMPRHLNRNATEFIADVTNAYAGSPKGFTSSTDLSANSADSVVKYWNEHLGTLKQHILDSLRTDRSFKQSAEMAAAEKKIAARWMAGNVDPISSVQDLVDLIAAEIPATTGKNPADVAVQGLNNELLQYVSHAERIQKERADDNAKTSGLSIALSSDNEFTKPAASLELPSEYYDYGAVTSIDRITALSRANHSALVDFANSLRLSIKELENRIGRLQKATTDKEREAILENYKGNPQEMEDVLQLLRNSLRNFEDSYRAGGPDVIPTKLGQKLLKATVGSVLAKVEIAARNLSQGQIQVLTNLWAMNYMSASLAAWKALSNVPRGAVNTGYLVARNIAGFADRRLGRDPQFQRTLKGAVDMVADAIFKSAQLALLKPRVGAANVRASFERVQNLGFDISDDWWEAAKQAWRESGQFRTQLDEQKAGRNAATWAANFIGRLANTGADAASAFVRGSVLEASDLNMNALSLGLVGNMEQRLQQVAMVFGKRLTDAGITEIDPANKDAMLRASEWLPSVNQQTAVNSLAEIRKFLESSASSEGFQLEKNLLQYYQDKMAGKPARMFNQRTYDAVQRSMIAENNAALPTNRASAGQASQLWRTMLALTGYPADAMLKLLRVSTGGSRDRKVVLQAASKMTAAIGFAAMAIIFQAAGDAGSELWKRKVQGKKPDRVTPLDADFWSDPEHMQRAMGKYLLMSAYFLGDFLQGAYGWVDGKSTIDPTQRAFVISTASQILRDLASGANIKFVKGGSYSEAFAPLRRTVSRLAFGVPELENMLGMERDSSEAARKAMAENARAKGMDAPVSTFRGVIGLTNIKRKALSQAVSDMEVAKRKGDTDGYNKAKAEAQKQIAELEAYYLKQRLEAGDSPEVAARTAKSSVWSDYQDNNPVTAALGGKRPTAEQYKQLVESSTGERGEVIRQGIKAWQDGAQALFGKPGNITKEDVAESRPGGTVKEPSYGRVSLTGGVSGRMRSVGTTPSRGRRAKIRRVSLTGRRRRISPLRGRRKKIRRVRLTA